MLTSMVTSEGSIKLPKKVRDALRVKAGAHIGFEIESDGVKIRPTTANVARRLAGSLRKYARSRDVLRKREALKEAVARAAAKEG